jgi:hypothetical protein
MVLASSRFVKAAPSKEKDILGLYGQTGDLMKGVEASLARLGQQTMSAGMHGAISSGLSNSSLPANIASKFAEETAAPVLANANAQRINSLAQAMLELESMNRQDYANQSGLANAYNMNSKALAQQDSQAKEQQELAESQARAVRNAASAASKAQSTMVVGKSANKPITTNVGSLLSSVGGQSQATNEPSYMVVNGQKFVMGDDGVVRKA